MENKTVYLDNSATTPLSPSAREAMLVAMEQYGNPSSLHALGQSAEQLVKDARESVLSALGVRRGQGTVIFTSCGTEATSLAIFGTAYAKPRRDATRILTTDSEHPATQRALDVLAADGFEIVKLPTRNGVIDENALQDSLDKKIFMATFMLVNNETGALYRVADAFSKIKSKYPSAITHCDAIQGFMRVRFSPATLKADLISLSGHKIHAPKGVGALYVGADILKAKKIVPFLRGGGQENGMRSGTENVTGIYAFGAATADMNRRRNEIEKKLGELYAYSIERIGSLGIRLNIPTGEAVYHIMNLTLPDVKSETMLHHLSADGVFVSSGSACSSHSNTPSGALIAFGLTPHEADCSLRVSFSEYNTTEDVDVLCASLSRGLEKLVRIRR